MGLCFGADIGSRLSRNQYRQCHTLVLLLQPFCQRAAAAAAVAVAFAAVVALLPESCCPENPSQVTPLKTNSTLCMCCYVPFLSPFYFYLSTIKVLWEFAQKDFRISMFSAHKMFFQCLLYSRQQPCCHNCTPQMSTQFFVPSSRGTLLCPLSPFYCTILQLGITGNGNLWPILCLL